MNMRFWGGLTLLWVFLVPSEGWAGNGAGYGGGAPQKRREIWAQEILTQGLKRLEKNDTLCALPQGRCPFGIPQSVCDVLSKLSDKQRQFCINTLLDVKQAVQTILNRPDLFEVMPQNGLLQDDLGKIVSGLTRLGPDGKIYLDGPDMANMSLIEVVALIAHELLHKVNSSLWDGYITDHQKIGPYPNGREFLDITGLSLAVHSLLHVTGGPTCPELTTPTPEALTFAANKQRGHHYGNPLLGCPTAWESLASGGTGYVVFGPSHVIEPGAYEVEFVMAIRHQTLEKPEQVARLDANFESRPIADRFLQSTDFPVSGQFEKFKLSFSIKKRGNIEFRVFSAGKRDIATLGNVLIPLNFGKCKLASSDVIWSQSVSRDIAGKASSGFAQPDKTTAARSLLRSEAHRREVIRYWFRRILQRDPSQSDYDQYLSASWQDRTLPMIEDIAYRLEDGVDLKKRATILPFVRSLWVGVLGWSGSIVDYKFWVPVTEKEGVRGAVKAITKGSAFQGGRIHEVYAKYLGRAPKHEEMTKWIEAIKQGKDLDDIAIAILTGGEYQQAKFAQFKARCAQKK